MANETEAKIFIEDCMVAVFCDYRDKKCIGKCADDEFRLMKTLYIHDTISTWCDLDGTDGLTLTDIKCNLPECIGRKTVNNG